MSVFARRRPYRILTHLCRIGNAFDAMATQLASHRQNVSHLYRSCARVAYLMAVHRSQLPPALSVSLKSFDTYMY